MKLQGALSNGAMRATPSMGWATPQAEVLPRQEGARNKKGELVVVGKTRLVPCDSRRVRALQKAASFKTLASYLIE